MGKTILLAVLKLLMILIVAGWISIWILKPTNLWTRKWRGAEDSARPTLFGYYGTYISFLVNKFHLLPLTLFLIYIVNIALSITRQRFLVI